MRSLAVHADALDLGAGRIEADAGVLLVVLGIEPGDRLAVDPIAHSAAADVDRVAAALGVEAVVLLPATHGELGPDSHQRALASKAGPVPDAIQQRLTAETVVVVPEEYPELSLSGTVHPTALQFRRYDGTLVPGSGSPEPAFESLERARIVDEGHETWTPRGTFLRDELLDRTRRAALEAGAVVRSGRVGQAVVPGATARSHRPPTAEGEVSYGVRRTPAGPQPELATRCPGRDRAIDDLARFTALGTEVLEPIVEPVGLGEADRPLRVRCSGAPREAIDDLRSTLPSGLSVDHCEPGAEPDRDSTGPPSIEIVIESGPTPVSWGSVVSVDDDHWTVRSAPIGRFGTTAAALVDTEQPLLPASLSPTQLRLVPIDERHEPRALAAADRLGTMGVRVDVDDSARPVGERLEQLRAEGVPCYVVVGDREEASDELPLADRRTRDQQWTAIDDVPSIVGAVGGRERYGPVRFSDRP